MKSSGVGFLFYWSVPARFVTHQTGYPNNIGDTEVYSYIEGDV